MIKPLVIFSFFILLFSCGVETNPGNINRYFYTNSEVSAPEDDAGTYVNWVEGNSLVFKFELTHPDEEKIADDELTEIFWIEVPAGTTKFSSSDMTDSDLEVYYVRSCFCGFTTFKFSEYKVEGKLLNKGIWEVSFTMTAKSDSYDQEFALADIGIYFKGKK